MNNHNIDISIIIGHYCTDKLSLHYDSFLKRLEYLTKLTKNIGAKPIFVNQVMNDGQLSKKLFFTNW